MNPGIRFFLAFVSLFGLSACARANVGTGNEPTIRCRLNTPTITTHGGSVTMHLSVRIPAERDHVRKPVNLAVVIDRSGSMSEENKMEYAKSALSTLIRQLGPEDILSIVMYDDVVEVLRPAARLRNKEHTLALLERIYPRGSTNLGAGMAEGFRQASCEAQHGTVNRVMLISDGLANTGLTDSHALSRIAREYRGQSISLTAMGVGLSYNEDLMMGLAESGGGNYYFIEHPEQLASIFRNECQLMSRLYTHNAVIEIKLHPRASLRDVLGLTYERSEQNVRISLGDLYYGEEREFAVNVDVNEGNGSLALASGSLMVPADSKRAQQSLPFSSSLTYTTDVAEVERRRDLAVQAKTDVLQSTKLVEEALQLFSSGDRAAAQQRLEKARTELSASPAAAASGGVKEAIESQLNRLGSYEQEMKDERADSQRTKKAIQYDNYKTQKQK
jgi:Ca-activated chloride channel family protein